MAIEGTSVEQRCCSFFFRSVLRMTRGSLDEEYSILVSLLRKKGTIEMVDVKPTFLGSAVIGGGFVVDLLDKLESLLVPAHWSPHTTVMPVHGFSRTLHKSTGHQVFAGITYKLLIE